MAEHLEDTTIAAMLDGALTPAERAGVEAHLDSCEECYEVFASAGRFLAEEGRPARFSLAGRPAAIGLAAAAVVVLALASVVFRGTPPGVAPASPNAGLDAPGAAARLAVASLPAARLPEDPWLHEGSAYGFGPTLGAARAAVLIGAANTDRAVALQTGREEDANELARKIARLQEAHGAALDESRVALGEWLEAARLAALARDSAFLVDVRLHQALDRAPSRPDPAAARALQSARERLRAPREAEIDWQRLVDALTDALLLS